LAAQGVLLRSQDLAGVGSSDGDTRHHWREALAHLPYAAPLATVWGMSEEAGESAGVHQALASYARSRDPALSMTERVRALETSFLQFKRLCVQDSSHLRLASLARVANDFGERAVAVNALTRLVEFIRLGGRVDPGEPFLAPSERFDSIAPGEALGGWIFGAILEQLEKRERFSSFYADPSALDRLEAIHALGFGSPEMERRLDLVRRRINGARAAKGLPSI
jgi:hypothetical protein